MPDKAAPVDLDAMTVDELTALRDAAENKRREKLEAAKDAVLNEAREKLAKLGLTLEAAMPGRGGDKRPRPAPAAAAKVAVKYRGPKGEEWSGRGRLPQWVADIEKQGKNRDEFLVEK